MTGNRSIRSRVLLLMIIGVVGPMAVSTWATVRLQGELDRQASTERDLIARLFAARADALLASGVEWHAIPHRHLFNTMSHDATVQLLDGEGKVIASSDSAQPRAGDLIAWAPLTVARGGIVVRERPGRARGLAGAVAAGALLLAIAFVFAWGASRSVTRPIASLTRAAERLASGELTQPIRRLGGDEVGRLSEALERMRVALKESIVRQLLARTMTAQEHERRRIARELHDETSQGIAALVMKIRAATADAPPGPLRARLDEAVALAVGTLEEVHRMIVDLRPSVLDDLGLKSAIVWYAEKHLHARVRFEFADFDRRLPPQHEIAVFRVAQEAMNNIARHSCAETVLIQAAVKANQLTLEIEDDGAGFDPATLASPVDDGRGFGLLGMRERVEMLGGSLRIESAPGKGTHVAVSLPLEDERWIASAS